jgi:hypothetical protein
MCRDYISANIGIACVKPLSILLIVAMDGLYYWFNFSWAIATNWNLARSNIIQYENRFWLSKKETFKNDRS